MLRHILWKFWFHKITEISTQERGHFPRDKLPQVLLAQEVTRRYGFSFENFESKLSVYFDLYLAKLGFQSDNDKIPLGSTLSQSERASDTSI